MPHLKEIGGNSNDKLPVTIDSSLSQSEKINDRAHTTVSSILE